MKRKLKIEEQVNPQRGDEGCKESRVRRAGQSTIYNVELMVGSKLLEQNLVAGKTQAIKLAKDNIKNTYGERRVAVYEIGATLQYVNGGVACDIESPLLGNGRPIFQMEVI